MKWTQENINKLIKDFDKTFPDSDEYRELFSDTIYLAKQWRDLGFNDEAHTIYDLASTLLPGWKENNEGATNS